MQESKIFVDGSTITSHVKRIRKKFMQVAPEFDCIETVYGMGYRWNTQMIGGGDVGIYGGMTSDTDGGDGGGGGD